jgi:hypothetical protein
MHTRTRTTYDSRGKGELVRVGTAVSTTTAAAVDGAGTSTDIGVVLGVSGAIAVGCDGCDALGVSIGVVDTLGILRSNRTVPLTT